MRGRALIALACALGSGCSKGSATDLENGGSADAGTDAVASDAGSVDSGLADAGLHDAASEAGAAVDNEGPGAVMVHLFEWKWSDIALECEQFLGPNGFAAVQVSPPSEHLVLGNHPWWQRYQTVSYELAHSRSGSEAEFVDMVARCKASGVGIYVDTVINHMTGQSGGTGSNGTLFTKYEYPGLYGAADFHQPACVIDGADYVNDADRVQRCELLGLADLDTGNPSVQARIAGYLSGLLALGVRGFRIDAAKHVAPADLDAILALVEAPDSSRPPYYFLEVIDYGGEAIQSSQYTNVGASSGAEVDVTEFRHTRIGDVFLNRDGQTLSSLGALDPAASGYLPSDRALVFTNNHDTQRGSAIWYADGPSYELANVFLLAFPYGYPSLMSSFAFDRTTQAGRDTGPPSDATGNTSSVYDSSGQATGCAASPATASYGSWVCEHRARSVVNMIAFRKATAAATISDFWSNGANQIAFGRGELGFVVINREDAVLERSFQTSLPEGSYCEVLGADFAANGCAATVAVDAQGLASMSVPANSAVAIHVDARP